MDNLKKIGISALAGSLLATSAYAGAGMTITGDTELTYTSLDSDEVTGNPLGMRTAIGLKAEGDVNGYGVTYFMKTGDQLGAMASGYMNFDLGDMGHIGMDQAFEQAGIITLDNNMPTAYEEVFNGVGSQTGNELGATHNIYYKNTFNDIALTAEYNPATGTGFNGDGATGGAGDGGSGYSATAGFNATDSIKVNLGYGVQERPNGEALTGTSNDDIVASNFTYTSGPVQFGYGYNKLDSGASGGTDETATMFGLAFNVNENFSISYGEQSIEFETSGSGTATTEDSKGISAAYTMGSASLRFFSNEADNVAGAAGTDDKQTEVSLNLSF